MHPSSTSLPMRMDCSGYPPRRKAISKGARSRFLIVLPTSTITTKPTRPISLERLSVIRRRHCPIRHRKKIVVVAGDWPGHTHYRHRRCDDIYGGGGGSRFWRHPRRHARHGFGGNNLFGRNSSIGWWSGRSNRRRSRQHRRPRPVHRYRLSRQILPAPSWHQRARPRPQRRPGLRLQRRPRWPRSESRLASRQQYRRCV